MSEQTGSLSKGRVTRPKNEIVLANSNPATIMTDPGMADVTYIEPLNLARMTEIVAKEKPDALLPNLGGQSGLNLSSELAQGVHLPVQELQARRGERRAGIGQPARR